MKVKCICETCGKEFLREKGEFNRNKRKGQKICCSLSCIKNIEHFKPWWGVMSPKFKHNATDEFSPFRWHLRNAQRPRRYTKKECDITLQDLKEQWDKQNGICPYTGWKLRAMPNTNHKHQLPKTTDRASLDRIDSKLGYIKGNIQFVSLMYQYAKNEFSPEEVIDFCESIIKKRATPESATRQVDVQEASPGLVTPAKQLLRA